MRRFGAGSRSAASPVAGGIVAGVCLGLAAALAGGCATMPSPPAAQAPAARELAPLPATDWADEVLYFVVLDRFADGDPANNRNVDPGAKGAFHGGDLAGLRQQLDEIASLGATAIWITPLVDNIDGYVTGAGFPDWAYHGYWADDFTRLDRRFGSEAELAALVADAHARGIRVLLDVVYNHPGYDSRYLTDPRTAHWLRSEQKGTCGHDDLTSCLAGLPDFRTELPEVRDYLMDAHLALAGRVGLDGFRLDTVKHVDHDVWQEQRRRTREELFPGFFLLGEVWGGDPDVLDPWFAGDEMDAGFDFSFQGSALGWVMGRGRTVAFDRYLKQRDRVRDGYLLAHFLSSHDVPGALHQLAGDRELFRLAAALQMTTRGLPVVYYGEEVGRRGGDWPENRSDMPWGDRGVAPGAGLPRDEGLREDYRRLIAIRRAHPALSTGLHESVASEGDLLVFARRHPHSGEVVFVAVNRGAEAASATLALPAGWQGARELWEGALLAPAESAAADGGAAASVALVVPPRSFRILADPLAAPPAP